VLDRTIGRWVYRLHLRLYRWTRGVVGHRTPLGPILLLSVTGRTTRRTRTTPLLYCELDGRIFVVASNGGRPSPPQWLLNVEVEPDVQVQIGAKRFAARARELSIDEQAARWPALTEFYPGWAHYQTLTTRPIRVIEITPTASGWNSSTRW